MTKDLEEFIDEAKVRAALPPAVVRKYYRVNAGLTQAELADQCGTTQASIARWEAGTRLPRGEARTRYCRVLLELAKAVAA